MAAELVMPQLGLTMTEGKVLRWYKQAGEAFSAGEPLFEVETDKVNMDVEATEAGRLLEIVAPLDELVAVRTVLARYARETVAGATAPSRILVSPRARKLAGDLHVDLSQVTGTGPGGRIVERDVQAVPAGAPPPLPSPMPSGATPSRSRQAMAERVTRSFQSAPHFYLTREVDASELLHLKRLLAAAATHRGTPPPSVTDLLLKAMALALVAHPEVNASWQDGEIRRHDHIILGLAVAREEDLIVPVIRDAEALPIAELVKKRTDLMERVRAGNLKSDDFGTGSATLSNLGMYGIDQFQAILNPPESLILATGRIRDRVVAVNGSPAVRPTLHCTVSADHRVLDGAQAARFLGTFAELLESPGPLLS